MGSYDDVMRLVELLGNIGESGDLEKNMFDMLLIARSYLWIYKSHKTDKNGNMRMIGAGNVKGICDAVTCSGAVFDSMRKDGSIKYFKKSYEKRRQSLIDVRSCIDKMIRMLSDRELNKIFKDIGNEMLLSITFLYGFFFELDKDNFDIQSNEIVDTIKIKRHSLSAMTCYKKLSACETLVHKESVKMEKRGKLKSARIMKNTYTELKKSDRISTMRNVIDSADEALGKTGEKTRGRMIFRLFKKVLSFISRKLTMRKVRATSQAFFKRVKSHTTYDDKLRKDFIYRKVTDLAT